MGLIFVWQYLNHWLFYMIRLRNVFIDKFYIKLEKNENITLETWYDLVWYMYAVMIIHVTLITEN